jgi:YidC/Oxa1 family membrane protein insertase
LQISPRDQIAQIQPQAYTTPSQNIFVADGVHAPVVALLPAGNHLAVGQQAKFEFQSLEGKPLETLLAEHPETTLKPHWQVTKGQERIQVNADGTLEALQPGDVTLQGTIPGLAADKGFLFIDALGRVGAFDKDGTIHWDTVIMVLLFGVSLYVNQILAGQGSGNAPSTNPQQDTANKITPILFSGMFLIFPLPSGVLMYMLIANIFQTAQTFILSREPLPENLQKLVDDEQKKQEKAAAAALPFEPKRTSPKKKPQQQKQ